MKKTIAIIFLIILTLLIGITIKSNAASSTDTMIWIDTPFENQTLEKGTINIQGWIMSKSKNSKLDILVDGKKVESEISRQSRQDVINAISGYGGRNENPTPGYIAKINISNISNGKHTLTVRALKEDGKTVLKEQKLNFKVGIYDTLIWIDTPSENSTQYGKINVTGWVMSDYSNNKIKILIDNKEQNIDILRQKRQDVINAISGYGENLNKTPGYTAEIDISKLGSGTHKFTLNVYTTNGQLLETKTTNFKVKKPDTLLQVDFPSQNQKVKTNLTVQGWVMSEDTDNTVEVEINGTTYKTTRQSRPDVLNAISGYGNKSNKTPGYKAQIDTSNMKDGTYNLTVKVLNTKTNETLASETRKITIKKYAGIISIDYPQVTMINEDTLDIQGWIMTQDDKSTLKIYVDNKEISTNNIIRQERPDVINSISGYGTIKENPKPGFKTTINLKGYSEGKHTIKVTSTSRTGEIIVSGEKKFTIYKNEYFGIDVSEHQSMVNFYQMTQSNKLDFMLTRVGWYSESQGKLQLDTQFERNYKLAKQYKIPLGTYLYSYATNVQEAKNEANALVKYLRENNMSFELPVFYDMEDKAQNGASKDTKTQMCIEFCEILKKAGYKVGIYSSKNWLTNYIDLNKIPDDYNIWVASYGTNDGLPQENVKFPGNHDIWQYTSTGKIDGISTNVDFNICYKKYW